MPLARPSLRYDETPIGRESDPLTSVVLESDLSVSRQHGRIVREASGVFYEDTDSRNGSWVNEIQVQAWQRVALPQGTLLRLGPTVLRLVPARAAAGETVLTGPSGVQTGPPEGDERPTQPAQTPEE